MKKYFMIFISAVTGVLIVLFLTGRLIDLPRGTHEAGLMGAAGVFAILALMTGVGYLAHRATAKS
jgi:hypothetical protein